MRSFVFVWFLHQQMQPDWVHPKMWPFNPKYPKYVQKLNLSLVRQHNGVELWFWMKQNHYYKIFCVYFSNCWFCHFISTTTPPKGSVLWWLCGTWRLTWRRKGVRSLWVLDPPPASVFVCPHAASCPEDVNQPVHLVNLNHCPNVSSSSSGVWCNKHDKRTTRPYSGVCEGECVQGKSG